uniref:AlNc14C9G1167 protein n=1 Tax=Albugo laibachii Nc14 TaxID=890382 RepID=F0W2B7_9STRA|nr:AlNc14C9G1167 [Albugo laibachii Nc14]|eukprot:CCA15202.1 AlNc14C9G1167 [Albugo laibachii Nc14]
MEAQHQLGKFLSALMLSVFYFILQKDPALCREKLQWINLHTKSSISVKIKKCWISVNSLENLQETTVQPVLDFGSTIATIYRTASTGHTSVINIPYSCIHSIEFTVDTRMVYIQTNEVTGLDEVSLLAFLVSRKHYTILRRALQDKFGETVQKHEVVQKKGITKFDDVKFQNKGKIVSEITASPKSLAYQRSTPTEVFRRMDQGLRNADNNCRKLKIDQISSQATLESQMAGFEDTIHKMSRILFARKKQIQVSQYTLTSQRDSIRNCLLFDLPQADVATSILHDDIKKRSEHISKWTLDALCDAYMNGALQTSTYQHGLQTVIALVLAVVLTSISFVRQF